MDETIKRQIQELLTWKRLMESSSTIPSKNDQALSGRGFAKLGNLTGIIKAMGGNSYSAIVPLAGSKTYFVADSSGGPTTRSLTFIDGILTSET